MRKEIWDWMVLCIEGEKKNLFCAHLVREVDKWDISQLGHTSKEFCSHRKLQRIRKEIREIFLL